MSDAVSSARSSSRAGDGSRTGRRTLGPATIEDVASATGVSVATVSRALRGLPNVAPSTRERVRSAAEDLQYRADPSAAALAAGRTRTVAMAVPVLDSWYFSQVMAGAESVLSEAGYDLLLFNVDGEERRRRLLGGPLVKRADGIILVDVRLPPDEADALVEGRVEVVTVGVELPGASSVMVDDFHIALESVVHLLGLGHTRIASLDGRPDDALLFAVPAERQRGYVAALTEAGVAVRDEYHVVGDFSVAGGRRAMAALLDLDDPPTAVFAMSDEMAFGALHELGSRGLRAPDDMSIIGIDDHELAAVVGLTTTHQQVTEHGAIAARMLLEQMATPGTDPRRQAAATRFVERETTGPCPG